VNARNKIIEIEKKNCSSIKIQYWYQLEMEEVSRNNPLTPELSPSTQRCLTRIFTRDFAS
jgi:hypothetical protein